MCYCHCGSIEYGCMSLCTHIPIRDSFMSAHTHEIAQRVLDFPALLRKNGFAVSMQCSLMLKKQPIAKSCTSDYCLRKQTTLSFARAPLQ